jgi:hypothetical protein
MPFAIIPQQSREFRPGAVLSQAPKRTTLRMRGGHRHHARSFRGGEVLGCAGDGRQLTAINQAIKQSSNQAIKQASVFLTEEQGRTIEHTEKQGYWRFAQESDQTPREAQPLAYSVDSIVLPCSSVIKTLALLLDYFITI